MIDLHTHTTASDGACSPEDLAARAAAAGVTVLAVTDHDTLAGCAPAATACASRGIAFVCGIEITAVAEGGDVHVLGYGVDADSGPLRAFLARQRELRIDRVREMLQRLSGLGIRLDADAILAPGLADTEKAVGRPWIARALVERGYVASTGEAFDRWLGRGCPGFVPRTGATPEDVFARVHDAGGLASLAHPILVNRDEWIPRFAESGLDALEVFHPDHIPDGTSRYLGLATRLGLLVTGGSDYHGNAAHGGSTLGQVSLPLEHFERLQARLTAGR